MTATRTPLRPREVAGRLATKLLTPLVASGVTAATTYAARRAPALLEEHVLPRLRGAMDARSSAPTPAAARGNAISTEQRERQRRERAARREARRSSTRS